MENRRKNHEINEDTGYKLPPRKLLTVDELTVLYKLRQQHDLTNVSYSHLHPVYLVEKLGRDEHWYLKEDDFEEVIAEVFAQEFFRLNIPNEPKTRIVRHNNNIMVLSKEIPNFTQLVKILDRAPQGVLPKLINGRYYGLGNILVIALVVNEYDLSFTNTGVNSEGEVLKIDGGHCFIRMSIPGTFNITKSDITQLPEIKNYQPYYWLGFSGKCSSVYDWVFQRHDLSKHPGIRHEINSAMLGVLLLPDEMIRQCLADCLTSEILQADQFIKKYFEELIDRRCQLKKAALVNKSFQEYLISPLAKTDLENYIAYLKTYKTIGKRKLNMEKYEAEMYTCFSKMRTLTPRSKNYTQLLFKPKRQTNTNDELTTGNEEPGIASPQAAGNNIN